MAEGRVSRGDEKKRGLGTRNAVYAVPINHADANFSANRDAACGRQTPLDCTSDTPLGVR